MGQEKPWICQGCVRSFTDPNNEGGRFPTSVSRMGKHPPGLEKAVEAGFWLINRVFTDKIRYVWLTGSDLYDLRRGSR